MEYSERVTKRFYFEQEEQTYVRPIVPAEAGEAEKFYLTGWQAGFDVIKTTLVWYSPDEHNIPSEIPAEYAEDWIAGWRDSWNLEEVPFQVWQERTKTGALQYKLINREDIMEFFGKLNESGSVGDLKIVALMESEGVTLKVSNSEYSCEYNVWPPCDPGDQIMVTISVVISSFNYYEPDDYDDREIGFAGLTRELVGIITGHFYQSAIEARLFQNPEE
jgi:hypothetical protein